MIIAILITLVHSINASINDGREFFDQKVDIESITSEIAMHRQVFSTDVDYFTSHNIINSSLSDRAVNTDLGESDSFDVCHRNDYNYFVKNSSILDGTLHRLL